MIVVSRRSKYTADGRKACSHPECMEARDVPGQRYCRKHKNEYARAWRRGETGSGMLDARVTPAELEAVLAARATAARGRHRRSVAGDDQPGLGAAGGGCERSRESYPY